jgi:SOS-response transcriptional repressor LexA
MSIKEKIGLRIRQERTAKGLTRKALAELTEQLNVSRINNYERGDRAPGPEEIKLLAKALEVSPSFLMCLSDDRQGKPSKTPGLGGLIPVLDYKQACNPVLTIQKMKEEDYSEKVDLVPVGSALQERIGPNAFALIAKDESMVPEFRLHDILIIDPDTIPNPGDILVAKLDSDEHVIVRKYKQLSASKSNPEIELIALNHDWAGVKLHADVSDKLVGTVVYLMRELKGIE